MSLFKKRRGWLSLTTLLVSLKFALYIYNKHIYQVFVSPHITIIMHETSMQENNMGIIGNNIRIMSKFLKVLEGILGKVSAY